MCSVGGLCYNRSYDFDGMVRRYMIIRVDYRLLIWYDIQADKFEPYYRYMVGDFVTEAREMGLHMYFVWQVSYGDYPSRQLEFVVENREVLRAALLNPKWHAAEERLKSYTYNYGRKVVAFENRFQF